MEHQILMTTATIHAQQSAFNGQPLSSYQVNMDLCPTPTNYLNHTPTSMIPRNLYQEHYPPLPNMSKDLNLTNESEMINNSFIMTQQKMNFELGFDLELSENSNFYGQNPLLKTYGYPMNEFTNEIYEENTDQQNTSISNGTLKFIPMEFSISGKKEEPIHKRTPPKYHLSDHFPSQLRSSSESNEESNIHFHEEEDMEHCSGSRGLSDKSRTQSTINRVGTRQCASVLEKIRRDNLKEAFERLRNVIPACQSNHSKLSVLEKATNYIYQLKASCKLGKDNSDELEHLRQQLVLSTNYISHLQKTQQSMQQKIAILTYSLQTAMKDSKSEYTSPNGGTLTKVRSDPFVLNNEDFNDEKSFLSMDIDDHVSM